MTEQEIIAAQSEADRNRAAQQAQAQRAQAEALAPSKPPALSLRETLDRVDNYTNALANRINALITQTGPINLNDSQRSDLVADVERLRQMGKESHNPTAEPPHNAAAAPDFSAHAGSEARPGAGVPNNDASLAEASQAGRAPAPFVSEPVKK